MANFRHRTFFFRDVLGAEKSFFFLFTIPEGPLTEPDFSTFPFLGDLLENGFSLKFLFTSQTIRLITLM